MSPFPLRIKLEGSDSDKGIDEDVGDADDDDLEFEENPFIIIEREGWFMIRRCFHLSTSLPSIPTSVWLPTDEFSTSCSTAAAAAAIRSGHNTHASSRYPILRSLH